MYPDNLVSQRAGLNYNDYNENLTSASSINEPEMLHHGNLQGTMITRSTKFTVI